MVLRDHAGLATRLRYILQNFERHGRSVDMRGRGVKKESRDGLARSAVAFPQELTARHGIG